MLKTCHEKGCNKLATFNKGKKTSGKFCGEHKKEGMISVMYKYYNEQVDKEFKRLPIALKWEILVDFVGGYVVRYNRLRRLMTGDFHKQIMEHTFELNKFSLYNLWLKPKVESVDTSGFSIILLHALNRGIKLNFRSDGQPWDAEDDPELLVPVSSSEFSRRDMCVLLFESKYTRKLSYGYFSLSGKWYITEVNDSIVLPPYEKHVYPSYPNTNKKLGRPVMKMKLHNPIPKVPSGLEYKEIKAWKDGKRFRY